MAKMKLTGEQQSIVDELYEVGDEYEGFKLVEKSPWEDMGKSQCRDIVFEYENKIWSQAVSRTGSYFTDYDYFCDEDVFEVEKKEVVTYKWVAVKD